MATTKKKRKKSKKRRTRRTLFFGAFLCTCLMAVVLFIFANVFCKVSSVEFLGEITAYTPDQVVARCDIAKGANLFSFSRDKLIDKLRSSFPLLDNIEIDRVLPDKVVVSAEDAVPVAALKQDDFYYIISTSNHLMNRVTAEELPEGLTVVEGAAFDSVKKGQLLTLKTKEERQRILPIAEKIFSSIEGVTYINLTDSEQITFYIGEQLVVGLGSSYQLDYKLQMVKAVIEEATFSVRTYLDASIEGKVITKPYTE